MSTTTTHDPWPGRVRSDFCGECGRGIRLVRDDDTVDGRTYTHVPWVDEGIEPGDLVAFKQDTGRAGDKRYQVVLATSGGTTLGVYGGKRAERAEAVVVTRSAFDGAVKVLGLRGDLGRAETEAHSEATRTQRRVQRHTYPVVPALWARAVKVVA